MRDGDKEETVVIPDECLTTFADSIDLVLSPDEVAETRQGLTAGTQAALCYAEIIQAAADRRLKVDEMTLEIEAAAPAADAVKKPSEEP